jgi:hypothetical protein
MAHINGQGSGGLCGRDFIAEHHSPIQVEYGYLGNFGQASYRQLPLPLRNGIRQQAHLPIELCGFVVNTYYADVKCLRAIIVETIVRGSERNSFIANTAIYVVGVGFGRCSAIAKIP